MMTTLSIEEISQRLSHTLDCLGYSPQMVKIRKNLYNNYDNVKLCIDSFDENKIIVKTVGSRGEGITKMYESDWDALFILHAVLVKDDHIPIESIPESVSVLHMVPCLLHPGHFKLLLIRHGTRHRFPERFFNPFDYGCWLSSKEFVSAYEIENSTVSGPARKNDIRFCPHDAVASFPCVCPRIIQQWIQRRRRYDWPPIELRERASHMPANIVATGQKGCPDEEIEWRVCFNEMELLLVDSWNDTQRKLYKCLKMVKKDVFVSAGFEISSYMMKNIVMWLSEAYPQSDFKPESLMSWIIKSLKLLRKTVKNYNLPYYMISERNLMSERIPRSQCKSLTREISDLIHCGPQLLWECKKLEFAMSMTPNELLYYKDRCDRLEVINMAVEIQLCCGGDASNYFSQLVLVLNSQWPAAVREMLKDKTELMEILCVLLG